MGLQFASSTEVAGSVPNRHGAGLVGDAGDRDLVLEVGVARQQVVVVHAEMAEHRLELVVQALLRGTSLVGL